MMNANENVNVVNNDNNMDMVPMENVIDGVNDNSGADVMKLVLGGVGLLAAFVAGAAGFVVWRKHKDCAELQQPENEVNLEPDEVVRMTIPEDANE